MDENSLKKKINRSLIEGRLLYRTRHRLFDGFNHWLFLQEEKVDFILGKRYRKKHLKNVPLDPTLVVFYSFQGDFTDNPKYILKELLSRTQSYKIIWIGREKSAQNPHLFPIGVDQVYEWWTYEAYLALTKAKIVIVNSVDLFKRPYPKNPNQIIIQTWHGSLGIKRFDKKANKSKVWVRAAEYSSTITDYLISNSQYENQIYRETYWPETTILEYGHPRNDCLFDTDNNAIVLRKKIFKYIKIKDSGQKIILYAPTFRDSKSFDIYNIDSKLLLSSITSKFGSSWILLCRFHPTVRKIARDMHYSINHSYDVTNYPDMQELLVISDIGITDYSSWAYDFVLTKRPLFLFTTDIDSYYTERGFSYPLNETPFPIATDNDQLANNILSFNYNNYLDKCNAFITGKGCFDDGNASKRVVDFIISLTQTDEVRNLFLKNLVKKHNNNPAATRELAIDYWKGTDVDPDINKAKKYALELRRDATAQDDLLIFDIVWDHGDDDSNTIAFEIANKLNDHNNKWGIARLAKCYWKGRGTNKDLGLAEQYMKKAANLDVSWAIPDCFDIMIENNNIQKNREAFLFIIKYKDRPSAPILKRIIRCYTNGIGTDVNKTKANQFKMLLAQLK